MGSRPVISNVSKAAAFDVFVARRCGFRYYWMQDVVPRCAIFAKLQNSLIQPRTSQKKFSLFENVSYFVFIVWRSTDRQFFLFSLCDFTQTSRFRSVRETESFCTGFMLYSGIHYVVVATILLREKSIKSAVDSVNLVTS